MMGRRTFLKLPALGALVSYLPIAWSAPVARRRALIIGIDKYELDPHPDSFDFPSDPNHAAAASSAAKRNNRFHDLDGAVNDAELVNQLLKDRFSFGPGDIVFLKNEQASRENILRSFRTHLIDAAAPGDASLFYYAGHGSQIRNVGSTESDQLDETLVPADSAHGAPDIRDKEMARLYRTALRKGILLTVVLDSCHSGGMSRGLWNQTGKTRNLPPAAGEVNDPPDVDPATGKDLPDPAAMGLLFLGAAREDQPAGEIALVKSDGRGGSVDVSHGAFTAALAEVLSSSLANQSIEQLCERVQAVIAGEGRTQVPICAGTDRNGRGLFNQPAGAAESVTLPVTSVRDGGAVLLRGGSALGLAPGCKLVRASDPPVRLELVRVDFGTSEAKAVGSQAGAVIHSGDLFKLETWVASSDAALKVYFPRDAPGRSEILETAKTIDSLSSNNGLRLLTDLENGDRPTHVLYWQQGEYRLDAYPAAGKTASLGRSPSGAAILAALNGASNTRVWAMLPPSRELAADIQLGAGTANPAVAVVSSTAACTYLLAGRVRQGELEYSWIFKDIVAAQPDHVRLPLQSDWTTSADNVTKLAKRLGRIYTWLNLQAPPGGDSAFPYQLAFARPGMKEPVGKGPFKFNDQYKFALQASPDALRQAAASGGVAKRYVYVFMIDSEGNATCFFPDPKNGNDQNLLPQSESAPAWIELTRRPYDLTTTPPAGTDNYFLVASEQPLDPGIFQWTGVRKHEQARGSASPLEALFSTAGEGTRGAQAAPSVPATWSIESMSIRSEP